MPGGKPALLAVLSFIRRDGVGIAEYVTKSHSIRVIRVPPTDVAIAAPHETFGTCSLKAWRQAKHARTIPSTMVVEQ